jgi:hypothetical protein
MSFVGTWVSTALSDRQLVFLSDGTGFVLNVSTKHPYFRWWLESESLHWQMFNDESMTSSVSGAHEAGCELEVVGQNVFVSFRNAPIPFGLKRFQLAQ